MSEPNRTHAPRFPLPDQQQGSKTEKGAGLISRRGFIFRLCAGGVALVGAGLLCQRIGDIHTATCDNCAAVALTETAAAQTQPPSSEPGEYKGVRYTTMERIGSLALPGGPAVILASPGSTADAVKPLEIGTRLIMTMEGDSVQCGREDGDMKTLEDSVQDPEAFHNYGPAKGQILVVTFDASARPDGLRCDEPVYIVRQPTTGGTLTYSTFVIPKETSPEAVGTMISSLSNDMTARLGSAPVVTPFQASEITY